MDIQEQVYSVSDFFEIINHNLEYSYPDVIITGEVSSFKINQNKWVFFDIKDEQCSIGCFMSIYQLHTPIEDGMMVKIHATPKLTKWGKFSLTIKSIELAGEGSIKKAYQLLYTKLDSEGLFLDSKKRKLPEFPDRIGLITSKQAAAYNDFISIINKRWSGLKIDHIQVQVQGDNAIEQIVAAIDQFNKSFLRYDVLVIIRGGGSLEDLQVFNTEPLVRAVHGSKTPTLVAIGHKDDVSLVELSADLKATTPTNAAQLVVLDKNEYLKNINSIVSNLAHILSSQVNSKYKNIEKFKTAISPIIGDANSKLNNLKLKLFDSIEKNMMNHNNRLESNLQILRLLDPSLALQRGYSMIKKNNMIINTITKIQINDMILIQFSDGIANTKVIDIIEDK